MSTISSNRGGADQAPKGFAAAGAADRGRIRVRTQPARRICFHRTSSSSGFGRAARHLGKSIDDPLTACSV